MHFAVITLFPEMFSALLNEGVVARGIQQEKLKVSLYFLRDFAQNAYRKVDDTPFGGGPGMVLMAEPLAKAIEAAKRDLGQDAKVVYLTPQGERFVQAHVPLFLENSSWIFICGRYEGIDQRLLDEYVDIELSVGDFVLSGGELPAMVVIDAISRYLPGVLGNQASLEIETFSDDKQGDSVDYPQYTRPREWRGKEVPSVLLNGHHGEILRWRERVRLDQQDRRRVKWLRTC